MKKKKLLPFFLRLNLEVFQHRDFSCLTQDQGHVRGRSQNDLANSLHFIHSCQIQSHTFIFYNAYLVLIVLRKMCSWILLYPQTSFMSFKSFSAIIKYTNQTNGLIPQGYLCSFCVLHRADLRWRINPVWTRLRETKEAWWESKNRK